MKRDHQNLMKLATAAFLALVTAAGCSRDDLEDPPVRYERRTDACTGWCEVKMDPDCGGQTGFADLDACIDQCTSNESINWELQPDGTDACFDEQVAFFGCFDNLSCEVRSDWFAHPSLKATHPCRAPLDTLFDCVGESRAD
ncbi:MAG: hypothetical protein JKY37_15270 [Nannocystaceae bacterium]|nr:hypothetical protein [Nannocystaceae bacterium]